MAIVSSENLVVTADVTTFVNNIKNYVSEKVEYDFNSPPQFTGTSVFNPAKSNKTKYPAQDNPLAIPLDNLAINDVAELTVNKPIKEEQISGQIVFNVLIDLVKKMTRVKKFTSTWHNKTGSTTVVVDEVSGTACFADTLLAIAAYDETSYEEAINTNYESWTRSTENSLEEVSTANPFTVNTIIDDTKANNFFDALKAEWDSLYNSKIMEYHLYTCHYNCHSNCHSSGRHRR